MELNAFFKSVLEQDEAPVVICDLEHTVVYMNAAAIARYHLDLTGKSLIGHFFDNRILQRLCKVFFS